MFSAIIQKLKEILARMIGGKTIENQLHVTPVISSEMESAIKLWTAMYKNQADWIYEPMSDWDDKPRVVSLGLPAMIASEKARTVLLEWESEITTPTEESEEKNPEYKEPKPDAFGNVMPSAQPPVIKVQKPIGNTKRAEFLNEQYKKNLKPHLRRELEYGIAKGGLVIKPYLVVTDDKDVQSTASIQFEFVQADAFYPLAFDSSNNITEAAFIQTKADKDATYRRLEWHKLENNKVTVVNKAFKAINGRGAASDDNATDLGSEIPLASVPEWKNIPEKTIIKDVTKPLFAYFKMPEANTIDTNSPLGVSGFSRAVNLIKNADMQYSSLLWEYEGGELAIDIDRDALRPTKDMYGTSHTVVPRGKQRLFRQVDLSQTGDTYFPYTPSLRDANYIEGLNTILMRIEDVCAISRGTLSDSADIARTATELKILKQRSYQANSEIQEALERTLNDVVYIMNVYCHLYNITPDGDYELSCEWDDSILVDADEELNKRITLMTNGIASKLEVRMWYFGETEEQAREALTKIDEESQKDMENELSMQSNQINLQNRVKQENAE